MLLHRLFSLIRSIGRGWTLPPNEPGVVISSRLKALLPVKNPKTVETTGPDPQGKEDENRINREKFGT